MMGDDLRGIIVEFNFSWIAAGFFSMNMPPYIEWMQYLSFLHYSYSALLTVEFTYGDPLRLVHQIWIKQKVA